MRSVLPFVFLAIVLVISVWNSAMAAMWWIGLNTVPYFVRRRCEPNASCIRRVNVR
jgi:hypothetical protein